uniref:Flavin_Reduct domain-containing protein n=2 Tax=Steinernema glaseri TaxID=37863 RepID=A0A1I7Z1J7_9BILA
MPADCRQWPKRTLRDAIFAERRPVTARDTHVRTCPEGASQVTRPTQCSLEWRDVLADQTLYPAEAAAALTSRVSVYDLSPNGLVRRQRGKFQISSAFHDAWLRSVVRRIHAGHAPSPRRVGRRLARPRPPSVDQLIGARRWVLVAEAELSFSVKAHCFHRAVEVDLFHGDQITFVPSSCANRSCRDDIVAAVVYNSLSMCCSFSALWPGSETRKFMERSRNLTLRRVCVFNTSSKVTAAALSTSYASMRNWCKTVLIASSGHWQLLATGRGPSDPSRGASDDRWGREDRAMPIARPPLTFSPPVRGVDVWWAFKLVATFQSDSSLPMLLTVSNDCNSSLFVISSSTAADIIKTGLTVTARNGSVSGRADAGQRPRADSSVSLHDVCRACVMSPVGRRRRRRSLDSPPRPRPPVDLPTPSDVFGRDQDGRRLPWLRWGVEA